MDGVSPARSDHHVLVRVPRADARGGIQMMKCGGAGVRRCGGAVLVAMISVIGSGITGSAAPQGDAAKKANVAISGCLLRQGYATLIVDEARVDGKGDAAATAQPTVAKQIGRASCRERV